MDRFRTGTAKLILLGAMVALATPVAAAGVSVNANAGHHPDINNSATVYTDQHGIASRLPTPGGFPGDLVRTDNGVSTYTLGSTQTRLETSASEAHSSARAYGDLSTGKVGAYAGTRAAGFAAASAIISDTLTFNIAGANANTVTSLRFLVSLHAATPESVNYFRFQAGSGNFTTSGPFSQRGGRANGWSESRIWVENSTMFADLVYNAQGANPTFGVEMTLEVIADLGGVSDFYQTAGLQIQAPSGVTFTSESGAFLTAGGVPEPATWAMMIIGFGMIGAVSRRRRTVHLAA